MLFINGPLDGRDIDVESPGEIMRYAIWPYVYTYQLFRRPVLPDLIMWDPDNTYPTMTTFDIELVYKFAGRQ